MAEILVLVLLAALLFAALTPFRRWLERRYIRRRGGRHGVVVAMRRRSDGSYAASEDVPQTQTAQHRDRHATAGETTRGTRGTGSAPPNDDDEEGDDGSER